LSHGGGGGGGQQVVVVLQQQVFCGTQKTNTHLAGAIRSSSRSIRKRLFF
jgi:hypothetical protein